MRKLFLLLLVITPLLIDINSGFQAANATSDEEYDVSYESNVYGPKEAKAPLKVEGSVHINSGPARNDLRLMYYLYSPLKYGMDRQYGSGYVGKKFSYPSTKDINYSFIIDDEDNYARKGITIRFGLFDTTNKKFLNYVEGHIKNKTSEEIDLDSGVTEYTYEPYLYLAEEKIYEKFNFSNFTHLLDVEEYFRLNLDSFSFLYEGLGELTYEEIYLSFLDPHDLFNDIEDRDNAKYVPLYINKEESVVSFIYQDLYVNPSSLVMSSIYKEGFIHTNYFYLPKNKIVLLEGYIFTIHIVNMGVSALTFTYSFELGIDHLLIGPCSNSSFCVVGGVVR